MAKTRSTKKQQNLLRYFEVSNQKQLAESFKSIPPEDMKSKNSQEDETESPVLSRKKKAPPAIFDSDEEDVESDQDEISESILKRRKRFKRPIVESSEEEDHQDVSHLEIDEASDQDDDMKDDLDFLDESDILQDRTRGKRVDKYAENLKKLKNRKSKLSEYDTVENGPIEPFVTSKHRPTIVFSSEEEDGSDEEEDEENDDENEFVVDDDIVDGKKVEKKYENAELPAEFSRAKLMSFNRQMDFYIQYLIERVLDPDFDISTQSKYILAENVVMRRVKGYRDSMATSDVWLPNFKDDVDKYTNWEEQTGNIVYDTNLVCEACRTNKSASIAIKLYSDDISESKTYHLGSECKRKAFIYHEFKHFETHMLQKVRNLVNDGRYRANKSQDIFDSLLQTSHIRTLRKSVTLLFSEVVNRYNPRGQRSKVVDDDSSSSEDDTY